MNFSQTIPEAVTKTTEEIFEQHGWRPPGVSRGGGGGGAGVTRI